MSLDRFHYVFHPVGQGLFASGGIAFETHGNRRFFWVYDCGTSSSPDLLQDAIADLVSLHVEPYIDLATISHFDRDHISGFPELLRQFSIHTLLLPYVPLWQRILIAFEEEIGVDEAEMLFFVNPVAYLNGLDGRIGRILLVLPSGPEGPPPPGPERLSRDPEGGHDGSLLAIPPSDLYIPSDDDFDKEALKEARGGVDFLRPGKALSLRGLWEFVPYNDQELAPHASDAFVEAVEHEKNNLLTANNESARTRSLKALKSCYDNEFGTSSEKRNLISLFLYGGPVRACWTKSFLHKYRNCVPCPFSEFMTLFCDGLATPGSILYTGDGYLDTPHRLKQLITYLDTSRIADVTCFQVMHHGSDNNCHQGVAKAIAPTFSVFCSDPAHKKFRHPDESILRDFWSYNPVRVDKLTRAVFNGFMIPA